MKCFMDIIVDRLKGGYMLDRIQTVLVLLACSSLGVTQNNPDTQSQAQSSRPRMIRVSGGAMGGLIDHKALPTYPDEALKAGIRGDVIFKIVVDEAGKIVLSDPVEGDPLLVAASVEALRDFRFRPYLLNGVPIRVASQLSFHFALKGKGKKAVGQVEYISAIAFWPEFRTGVVTDKGVLVLSPRKISGSEPQLPSDFTVTTVCCVLAAWVSGRKRGPAALAPQSGLDLAEFDDGAPLSTSDGRRRLAGGQAVSRRDPRTLPNITR